MQLSAYIELGRKCMFSQLNMIGYSMGFLALNQMYRKYILGNGAYSE